MTPPLNTRRRWEVRSADCLAVLPKLDASSIDAVITDPPYGLNFMGKDWDRPMLGHVPQSGRRPVNDQTGRHDEGYRNMQGYERQMQEWHEAWAREALRVLKPGGHLLAFGGTRTFHRLTCALEDAGFEIRDCLCWLYGQGFPKSLNVSVAIDKAEGHRPRGHAIPVASTHFPKGRYAKEKLTANPVGPNPVGRYRPRSRAARAWQGWGTALKPGWEPIIMARKPLDGTVAQNVHLHGTGALNIDGCRIGFRDPADERSSKTKNRHADFQSKARKNRIYGCDERARGNYDAPGRWPANVTLTHTEDCRHVGHTRVRSNGHHPAVRRAGGLGTAGHKGQDGLFERSSARELVDCWECSPDCPVRLLDEQSGDIGKRLAARLPRALRKERRQYRGGRFGGSGYTGGSAYTDASGASRFFYCAKASRAERNAGLNRFSKATTDDGRQKPIDNPYPRGDRAAKRPSDGQADRAHALDRTAGHPAGRARA